MEPRQEVPVLSAVRKCMVHGLRSNLETPNVLQVEARQEEGREEDYAVTGAITGLITTEFR